ncbi:MAG: hypothetical protein WCI73_00930 [Phycisphaerae bacterium]
MAYAPDYGLRLLRDGITREVDQIFYDFRLFSLDILGRGRYSTLVQMPLHGQLHALSLDLNHDHLERILAKADPHLAAFIHAAIEADPVTPRRIDFEGEVAFAVRARLGQIQTTAKEQYVPLVAQDIL